MLSEDFKMKACIQNARVFKVSRTNIFINLLNHALISKNLKREREMFFYLQNT